MYHKRKYYTRRMVPYEYRYLCKHKYPLALLNSISSTGTYAPEFMGGMDVSFSIALVIQVITQDSMQRGEGRGISWGDGIIFLGLRRLIDFETSNRLSEAESDID